MTSARKAQSNARNAALSTGPRTPGGKSRSRSNALRHGLAVSLDTDVEENYRIDGLASVLTEAGETTRKIEQSRIVAETYFDLRRIRVAREDIFFKFQDLQNASLGDLEIALGAIDRIGRYERRALSKRKHALRGLGD